MTDRRSWLIGVASTASMLVMTSLAAAGSRSGDPPARTVPVEGGAYTDVDAAGLAALLQTKSFPLINVHIPCEGEIDGTGLFIPFEQIEANLARLPADKGARVVLYCRSGSMSATAARALLRRGYTDIWNLDGGMLAWARAGYPLQHRPR
jgi:rhodanese-related sulfurtransferase